MVEILAVYEIIKVLMVKYQAKNLKNNITFLI